MKRNGASEEFNHAINLIQAFPQSLSLTSVEIWGYGAARFFRVDHTRPPSASGNLDYNSVDDGEGA